MKSYCIHKGYQSREGRPDFDDTPYKDEFQDQVYAHARKLLMRDFHGSVLDVGCGSGYKLLKYFSDVKTLGLDVQKTVDWLKNAYRFRNWQVVDLSKSAKPGYDLLICSDVVEHMEDPDELMQFIKRCAPKVAIVSTPERDLLGHGTFDGPPKNWHHVREWNLQEFNLYLLSHGFTVRNHWVDSGTQIAEVTC